MFNLLSFEIETSHLKVVHLLLATLLRWGPARALEVSIQIRKVIHGLADLTFQDLYDFAEANNITLLGDSSSTVAAAGGWVAGGGHGALSPLYGLAMDNALQLKAVLPMAHTSLRTDARIEIYSMLYEVAGGVPSE